jgi:hypothetical protein
MSDGIKDVVKAFTILGAIVSIKTLIDSQRAKSPSKEDHSPEQLQILYRLEAALKRKGIID